MGVGKKQKRSPDSKGEPLPSRKPRPGLIGKNTADVARKVLTMPKRRWLMFGVFALAVSETGCSRAYPAHWSPKTQTVGACPDLTGRYYDEGELVAPSDGTHDAPSSKLQRYVRLEPVRANGETVSQLELVRAISGYHVRYWTAEEGPIESEKELTVGEAECADGEWKVSSRKGTFVSLLKEADYTVHEVLFRTESGDLVLKHHYEEKSWEFGYVPWRSAEVTWIRFRAHPLRPDDASVEDR